MKTFIIKVLFIAFVVFLTMLLIRPILQIEVILP